MTYHCLEFSRPLPDDRLRLFLLETGEATPAHTFDHLLQWRMDNYLK